MTSFHDKEGVSIPEKVSSIDQSSENQSDNEDGNLQHINNKYVSWIYKLDDFGIETRGIERVSSEERRQLASTKPRYYQFVHVIGLWFSACGGLTSMSSFFLSTFLFGLDMRNSMVSGLIGMVIGCLVPAYCSTMGPKSGCRQMVGARFLFGQWGVKFVSVICIVGGIGWSVVNCVLGGQLLISINHNIPLSVGIVLISVISLIIAIFGIRVVLKFQTIMAIPLFIATILFYVVVCKKLDYVHTANQLVQEMELSSLTIRGNWLSFFTLGYSVTATWGSGASDYYILFPEETPAYQVFLVTFLGITIPSLFVAIPGTLCGVIAYGYPPWTAAYDSFGVGGLINEVFKPWGKFGSFVVVILYISLICNNIMNTYSIAFEFQLIDVKLAIVPRWCWAILVTIIYIVLSIAGKEHLSTIISNFLPMLGYWISIYITILLEENLIFRSNIKVRSLHHKEFQGKEEDTSLLYNWANWNKPRGRTMGLAAAIAFAFGVVGAVLGMNQEYYQGVLAIKIGVDGGDIGFWLSGAFTAVSYPLFRYIELKRFGR
ncbi:purine-cytosine transport protein [Scheffersomyces coipomensis]|uniref:purine-cytosine transport protein n=1 Tax=Scheffersomyces coipomensis TaxID=1788519 RepID=UPI00315D2E71